MNGTVISHIVNQNSFNDAVLKVLKSQSTANKICSGLIIGCCIGLYFHNKKIGKLTNEVKELKQMKGA